MLFQRSLNEDLKSETSGDFGKMILALANGDRDESVDIDPGPGCIDQLRS